jgi:hypothetical protein
MKPPMNSALTNAAPIRSGSFDPLPQRVALEKRIRPDFIDIVPPRWLALNDRTGPIECVGGVDAFTGLGDSEHGCFALLDGAEAGLRKRPPQLAGLIGPLGGAAERQAPSSAPGRALSV